MNSSKQYNCPRGPTQAAHDASALYTGTTLVLTYVNTSCKIAHIIRIMSHTQNKSNIS